METRIEENALTISFKILDKPFVPLLRLGD